jgi:hypothetical protein
MATGDMARCRTISPHIRRGITAAGLASLSDTPSTTSATVQKLQRDVGRRLHCGFPPVARGGTRSRRPQHHDAALDWAYDTNPRLYPARFAQIRHESDRNQKTERWKSTMKPEIKKKTLLRRSVTHDAPTRRALRTRSQRLLARKVISAQ